MEKQNIMRNIKIEKIVLSCGGVKDELEKSFKLLGKISGKKPARKKSMKRIPGFGVRPKMEVGCMVTLRGEEAKQLLPKLLAAIENNLRGEQISDNHFSFGIEEYILIPGQKYDRDIGMIGLKATIVFSRNGKRISKKKMNGSRIPKRQHVKKEEIIKFMEDNFGTNID